MEVIFLKTTEKIEVIDITKQVEEIVLKSGAKTGMCHVFAPHGTAAIILQENEEGLVQDIKNKIREIFYSGSYMHDRIDDNAASHLASGFLSQSATLPVKDSELVRGTWQNILFIELDGPRSRREVLVSIIKN